MDFSPSPAVVLTRAVEDNAPLAVALARAGVRVVEVPCTTTRLLPSAPLPFGVDAVVITSRRGVAGLLAWPEAAAWLSTGGCDGSRPLLGVVGDATAAALASAGWAATVVADPPQGEVLAQAVSRQLSPGARVAVVRGTMTSGEPETTLAHLGMSVATVMVYENVEPAVARLPEQPVAAVLAAAPSAARRLLAANPWLAGVPFVVPGDTTAKAVRALGVRDVRAAGPALAPQLEALLAAYRGAVEGR